MKLIRKNIFETNSSSTHSLTMCTKSEFDRFKDGTMVLYADEVLVPISVYEKEVEKLKEEYLKNHPDFDENSEKCQEDLEDFLYYENEYKTYKEWCNDEYLETYVNDYTTPNGEEIVAFGKYGYDA